MDLGNVNARRVLLVVVSPVFAGPGTTRDHVLEDGAYIIYFPRQNASR